MFRQNTGVGINDGEFTDSGRDTNYNVQNNYIIGVFPDVIGYIKTAAQYILPLTNKSTGVDERSPLPQAAGTTDQTTQSSISERDPVEITDIVPPDPSSLPISSIADRYTRSMLECMVGYPLYEPRPFSELSEEYARNGVNVGDVGFIRKDGTFDFLFNICPPRNAVINPSNLPDGFSLETPEHSRTKLVAPLPCKTCYFSQTVTTTEPDEYICERSDGAVLVLPEGAVQHEAINTGWFEDLAKRHGVEWYKYTNFRGRSISNGSLYLVTSFTKCTQWGIAVFDRPCKPGQSLTFVNSPLGWNGSGAIATKVADPNEGNTPNQCVFLQGYKIMIREDIFNGLPKRQPAHRIRGGGGTDFFSNMMTGNPFNRTKKHTMKKSDAVVLHSNFNSPPAHPSDLINSALLSQHQDAKIALTHDSVWCDLLRDNFPELNYLKLRNIALSYTCMIDDYGSVCLKKISDRKSSHPVQTIKAPEPQVAVQGLGDERNPATSTAARAMPQHSKAFSPASDLPSSSSNIPWKPIVRNIANKLRSVNRGDGVVHRAEAPSMSFFEGVSNITIKNPRFGTTDDDATMIWFGDGRFTEAQKDLICYYITKPAVLPGINGNINRKILPQSISGLPRADVAFDDYRTKKNSGPCFEGTRVDLLLEMADWFTGTDKSGIYVLCGLAGTGKSTIAYTIASRAATLNLLGASFFFSRDESDGKNAKKFFTTIASQLCAYDETFSKAIGEQAGGVSAMITKGPLEQLHLIVGLLRDIVRPRVRPILLIVDAVDECDEEDRVLVLTGLRRLVEALPLFKVILTIRPQPDLDRLFGSQQGDRIFRLQDIETQVVDGDIRRYLKHCLVYEQVEKFPERRWWANDVEIDCLVYATGGIFIIASTLVRIILNEASSDPAAQIQKLLAALPQNRMPFKDLDEFYTIILRDVVLLDGDDEMVSRYQLVVSAIILTRHPLPVTILAHIIDMDINDIRTALVKLQSMILLGDDDIPRIYHKSFADYVTDSKLFQGDNIRIDPTVCNMQIATCCFQIMEQHFKYNILGLGTPARFMSNEDGIAKDGKTDEQLERDIPQQLRYACVYWADHLTVANTAATDVMKELERFANEHLLHWFEALSLIGKLDCAHRAIRTVLNALNQTPSEQTPSDLRRLLLGGLQFISRFYEMIEQSALHIYYSALPLTPTNSLLYRRYIKKAVHIVCDIDGGPERWTSAQLIHGNSAVDVDMKFSIDGTMLVSLSKEKLKIWDTANGTPISTMTGANFAIANDFSTIASFEGDTITLYDKNGNERGVTFTTPIKIVRVAISSQSSRIAAMLSNKTLLLWDSRNGELITSDRDRDRAYDWAWSRLQISATGARLAHPSANSRFLRLRNGVDGSIIADLDCGSVLHQFAFLADDSLIATLSETDLKLWGCDDGKLVGISGNGGKLLAISATGSLFATGYDNKVTIWSGSGGNRLLCIRILNFDHSIGTMAFAPDDILAISINNGFKFYDVKARSFLSTLSVPHSRALVFSPDGTCLAAHNGGGVVYLWDIHIQSFKVSSFSSKQERSRVTALALSRDCSRIACGFSDGALELRETVCLAKRPIATHKIKGLKWVKTLGWSPDGRLFASSSHDGSINLWDGKNGVRCGIVVRPESISKSSQKIEVSNTVVAVADNSGLFLWDLKTMNHMHTFEGFFEGHLSFSPDGALLAAVQQVPFDALHLHTASHQTSIFDVASGRIIAKFDIDSCAMAFLPDSSNLVVQQSTVHDDKVRDIFTFNLDDQKVEQGPRFEEFMQLRNAPICLGVPISISRKTKHYCLEAFYSQENDRVPVLWIPHELDVQTTAEGHSMIALGCQNGGIILLRLHTSPFD